MGMTESVMLNFEDTTVKYQDKSFYVVKQFEYNNKSYLYCIDVNTVNSEDKEYAFLYRVDGDIFNHVQDDALWDELFDHVASICTQEVVAQAIDETFKK